MNSFGIPNTPANRALASTVDSRIRADARQVAANAAFWRLLGLGAFLLLTGIGVGAAFFGYSYATDTRAAEGRLATAIANALDRVTLKLNPDSTVKVNPDSTVKLNPDSTVKLDTTGAIVRLDTRGAILGHPTDQQLGVNTRPESNAKSVTDFTIFKHIPFGHGVVVSGWVFNSNQDATPAAQFCYYTTGGINGDQNMSMRYDLGKNGVKVASVPGIPVNLDQAFSNCVWFGS